MPPCIGDQAISRREVNYLALANQMLGLGLRPYCIGLVQKLKGKRAALVRHFVDVLSTLCLAPLIVTTIQLEPNQTTRRASRRLLVDSNMDLVAGVRKEGSR